MVAPVIVVVPTSAAVPAQVVTASLAAGFRDAGMRPAVVAVDGGPDVAALTGTPVEAATGAGQLPAVVQAAGIAAVARRDGTDLVLVHAPVGLLAPIDASNASLADALVALTALDVRVGVVVAALPDADALGHTALVAQALRARAVDVLGVAVVGHDGPWPDAARLEDVAGTPLLGTTPPGAQDWDAATFTDRAGAWLPLE